MATTLTAAGIVAALNAATDVEHAAIRAALKARVTPEAAAAAEAFITRDNACTAGPVNGIACSRTGFRTAGRAASHDPETGHVFRPVA